MSPEQALGVAVTAASDWYSVGVILYQALTGRLPFDGTFDEVVLLKQTAVPPAPDTLVPGLPEDLVRLCQELLARDPAGRPRGPGILKRLRGHSESTEEVSLGRRSIPLIGRSWHRHVLDSGYDSLVNRQTSTVFVFGRTGTGKTTLIRSFLNDLRSREDALVLAGRCYEQEWVPFKAVDSLIDALARHLKQLSASELTRLLPHDVSLLARVFPVIRSVDGVLAGQGPVAELPDPQELRMRVFAGLRELLVRLGRETNLVLIIDDLQWGDVDSAVLLADLIYSPDPPILLFLGSYRLEDADQNKFLRILRQARDKGPGMLRL
jgi:Cdc6-like AAA superfamily ATPase